MKKLSVEDVESYWDHRIKDSKDSWESVLWVGLPAWNKYVDKLHMYHLRRYMKIITLAHLATAVPWQRA